MFQRLANEFAAAHREGVEGLRTGDYARLGAAVERERRLIMEQRTMIEMHLERLRKH